MSTRLDNRNYVTNDDQIQRILSSTAEPFPVDGIWQNSSSSTRDYVTADYVGISSGSNIDLAADSIQPLTPDSHGSMSTTTDSNDRCALVMAPKKIQARMAGMLQAWYTHAMENGYTIEVAFLSHEGELLPHNGLWKGLSEANHARLELMNMNRHYLCLRVCLDDISILLCMQCSISDLEFFGLFFTYYIIDKNSLFFKIAQLMFMLFR